MLQVDRRAAVEAFIWLLLAARESGNTVFFIGNGGSAATASHFANDISIGTRTGDKKPFRAVSLTDNVAVMTALANDEGYENVFVQQLVSFLQPEDVVIGISTSGNSPNVLRAIELGNRVGAKTVGLTGFDGGQLGSIVDYHIHVPSDCIEQVEDIHLVLEHLICTVLRQRMKVKEKSASLGLGQIVPSSGDGRGRG